MAYRDLHCFAALSAGHTSAIKPVRRTTTWRRPRITTAPFLCNHVDACAYVSCMCGWAGVHIEKCETTYKNLGFFGSFKLDNKQSFRTLKKYETKSIYDVK